MISGKIELNKFVQIRLILDVKYGDDPMSNRFQLLSVAQFFVKNIYSVLYAPVHRYFQKKRDSKEKEK